MKLMEIYTSRYPRYGSYNPLDDERREQQAMDYDKRDFKRREMEHELAHEDDWNRRQQAGSRYPSRYPQRRPAAPAQQALGQFVISIAGRVWKKNGQPVTFSSEQRARSAAQTIRQRMMQRGENGDVDVLPTR